VRSRRIEAAEGRSCPPRKEQVTRLAASSRVDAELLGVFDDPDGVGIGAVAAEHLDLLQRGGGGARPVVAQVLGQASGAVVEVPPLFLLRQLPVLGHRDRRIGVLEQGLVHFLGVAYGLAAQQLVFRAAASLQEGNRRERDDGDGESAVKSAGRGARAAVAVV